MDPTNKAVERNRKLLYDVAGELRRRGYAIAQTTRGERVEEPQPSLLGRYDSMGILARATPKLFGLISIPFAERWAYLTAMRIDNEARQAVPDKQWVFDVYGEENIERVRRLGESLAKPRGIRVLVNVSTQDLRWEGQALEYPGLTIPLDD
ncbi:MAG: hypothetical protein HY512_03540 [Candidatus Aenigmarchaeota archaeon]|nr:hypothetical protein [Candidatus Aenigmarchaeota archaeon]